jgi:hypothetical protein
VTRPRKKWRITYRGSDVVDRFTSEKATFEFVQALARSKAGGVADVLTVWVDEGSSGGWQRFETFNMVEMAATVTR